MPEHTGGAKVKGVPVHQYVVSATTIPPRLLLQLRRKMRSMIADDNLARLEMPAGLRETGALSAEEFERGKALLFHPAGDCWEFSKDTRFKKVG